MFEALKTPREREREREKRGVEVTVDPEHLKPEAGAQEADPLRVLGGAAASLKACCSFFEGLLQLLLCLLQLL